MARLLIDSGYVDVNRPDGEGATPLLHAARNGHEKIGMLLMETGNVDVDKADSVKHRTPLSHLDIETRDASGGHYYVVLRKEAASW
ncbi:hypothetical protein B0H63DRAFT_521833 [Podospora didyma]|uniref:Ankyrin n=1 Tax=Podospora didyma TaxID=330526 RepID=A0AAE0NU73_9PEZI|nr:hypothetical protein B0H63DRAFT_521833 [Podospora didyma]